MFKPFDPFANYLKHKAILSKTREDDSESLLEVMEYFSRNGYNIDYIFKPHSIIDNTEVFSYSVSEYFKDGITSIAFSDNDNLMIGTYRGCYHLLNPSGKVLKRDCLDVDYIDSVSYCCGKFGLSGGYEEEYYDENYMRIYLFNEDGTLWKQLGIDVNGAKITLLPSGFIVYDFYGHGYVYFDFNGNMKWKIKNPPFVIIRDFITDEYIYMRSVFTGSLYLVRLSDGKVIKEIKYEWETEDNKARVWDAAICDKYLVISTDKDLYLYDLSNLDRPKKLWSIHGIWGFLVKFSPSCRYILVASGEDSGEDTSCCCCCKDKIRIFSISGHELLEKDYEKGIADIAWGKKRFAVATDDGFVHVYEPKLSAVKEILEKRLVEIEISNMKVSQLL